MIQIKIGLGNYTELQRNLQDQQELGIPEGSALSVLAWILYTYDTPLPTHSSSIFVDDSILWAMAPTKKLVNQALFEDGEKLINMVWHQPHINQCAENYSILQRIQHVLTDHITLGTAKATANQILCTSGDTSRPRQEKCKLVVLTF